jgi:hypothetical protein
MGTLILSIYALLNQENAKTVVMAKVMAVLLSSGPTNLSSSHEMSHINLMQIRTPLAAAI